MPGANANHVVGYARSLGTWDLAGPGLLEQVDDRLE